MPTSLSKTTYCLNTPTATLSDFSRSVKLTSSDPPPPLPSSHCYGILLVAGVCQAAGGCASNPSRNGACGARTASRLHSNLPAGKSLTPSEADSLSVTSSKRMNEGVGGGGGGTMMSVGLCRRPPEFAQAGEISLGMRLQSCR